MSREAPFDPDAICDVCGCKGAYDFMGDIICSKCCSDFSDGFDEDDPFEEELDDES